MRRFFSIGLLALIVAVSARGLESPQPPVSAQAQPSVQTLPSPYKVDPASVQWSGPAYRYPQAGWIVLHIEGEPYERGVQHGKLLSKEISRYVRCMAEHTSAQAPSDSWNQTRTLVNSIFTRRFDREYLEEMQGIADGASAEGANFDGRPLDLTDIVAVNVWAEIMTLDGALHATPTGLEGIQFKEGKPKSAAPPHGEHCSAFAATGPATADGKIVFGHITMYDLYPSSFFNVWIDVKPAKGHRISMQSYPGGIQSGLDYYVNDAGLMVTETTIAQTRFDANGNALSSQIRKAVQYGDSIDTFVAIMKESGNGLYSNEWLLGDAKTNEIAMFELGTKTSKLWRSSKNEWYGGTAGFYWGDNNVKDREVRLETLSTLAERPANMTYHPKDRDILWIKLYQKHKGHIDANFGIEALSTAPIASFTSVDAKVTTTDMAKEMLSLAHYGPPLGRSWQPNEWERSTFKSIVPMIPNPWTRINVAKPEHPENGPAAVEFGGARHRDENGGGGASPSWRGTLLPKTDADTWLAVAFAEYEQFFSHAGRHAGAAREMFSRRANYLYGVRNHGDTALVDIKSEPDNANWYRISAGKGFFLLHELRALLGDKVFAETLEAFGKENAGKDVATADFVTFVQKSTGKDLHEFFDTWLKKTGLPRLKIVSVKKIVSAGKPDDKTPPFALDVTVAAEGGPVPAVLDVTVQGFKTQFSATVHPDANGVFHVDCKYEPRRITLDKYSLSALGNGCVYTIGTFHSDLEQTLIVYGTLDEAPSNAEAAEVLQSAIIHRGTNIKVAIRSDREVTEEELKTHHLLLIGRPDSNRLCKDFASAFPVTFGTHSFRVLDELYAHAGSGVVAVAPNPREAKFSVIMIAGLSAPSTYSIVQRFGHGEGSGGEVSIFENGGNVHSRIVPPPELSRDVDGK